jgi:hypothetical protein
MRRTCSGLRDLAQRGAMAFLQCLPSVMSQSIQRADDCKAGLAADQLVGHLRNIG